MADLERSQAEGFDRLERQLSRHTDATAVQERVQDERTDLLARALYLVNGGSLGLDWPKADRDNWDTGIDGSYRSKRTWPREEL